MEAHQTLEEQIDLQCCSRIDVLIRNKEAHPETVTLELIVGNTSTPKGPVLSLGEQESKSGTLRFDVPANPEVRGFDDMRVVFHLYPSRANRAAHIAIDQFELVPRTP
jgi:hypothetical protein